MIHRRVGVAQEDVAGLAVVGEGRDADARRDEELVVPGADRPAHVPQDALRDDARREAVARAGQQDDELVAAEPRHDRVLLLAALECHDVARPHDLTDQLGELAQHFVGGVVADRIVDALEVVEVDEQHRELAAVAAGAREASLQQLVEATPVRQAGEPVVIGEQADLLVRLAELAQHLLALRGLGLEPGIRRAQLARPRVDHRGELVEAQRRQPHQLPATLERVRELTHLDRVEGLLEDEHAVGVAEGRGHVLPAVVGVGRADDDADVGVFLQHAPRRLDAVHAGRHAHVDEGERVRTSFAARRARHLERLVALIRGVQREAARARADARAEELLVQCVEIRVAAVGFQDPAEVLVDGTVVVDDQDARVALRVEARRRVARRGLRGGCGEQRIRHGGAAARRRRARSGAAGRSARRGRGRGCAR